MTAYVHGELSPRSRRRVVRYIDECPDCYAEYQRQRRLMRELAADMPVFGEPSARQLDRIWAGVQAEVNRLQPRAWQSRPGYGLAGMAMLLLLVLPLTLGNGNVLPALATQPAPTERLVRTTASPPSQVAVVGYSQSFNPGVTDAADDRFVTLITPEPALTLVER
jgi:anti-sigma factor RsiW